MHRRRLAVGAGSLTTVAGACSDSHRHHDVLVVIAIGHGDERARVGVAEGELDLFHRHVLEHVEQIVDVEANIERIALVIDLELLLGLLLLAVRADDLQLPGPQHETHAAELFVRQDRRPLQRREQVAA